MPISRRRAIIWGDAAGVPQRACRLIDALAAGGGKRARALHVDALPAGAGSPDPDPSRTLRHPPALCDRSRAQATGSSGPSAARPSAPTARAPPRAPRIGRGYPNPSAGRATPALDAARARRVLRGRCPAATAPARARERVAAAARAARARRGPLRGAPADVAESARRAKRRSTWRARSRARRPAAVARRAGPRPPRWVLGADTIVVLDGEALGKPRDAEERRRACSRLRGRTHRVLTGVALAPATRGARRAARVVESPCTLRAVTEAELRAYVATGEPLDKAGAYAAQGDGRRLRRARRGQRDAT